jgi:hypothetical protein
VDYIKDIPVNLQVLIKFVFNYRSGIFNIIIIFVKVLTVFAIKSVSQQQPASNVSRIYQKGNKTD